MGILRPLKVVIDNYPENQIEHLDAVNNPENPDMGTRQLPFSREIYIEKEDFMENPPKKFYRLSPGNEVRLRYGYFIKCVKVVKDLKTGDISELHCTYDPKTRGGQAPDKRKVKGTIHWVSAQHAIEAEIHLYEHLFTTEKPESDEDGSEFKDHLNPNSMITLKSCKLEPSLANAKVGENYQFERQGYFCIDQTDSSNENMIFNRTVSLRDSWAKMYKTQTSN
jgi:glutaminyl-tRNA synthetase